jgi:hypothetical protein
MHYRNNYDRVRWDAVTHSRDTVAAGPQGSDEQRGDPRKVEGAARAGEAGHRRSKSDPGAWSGPTHRTSEATSQPGAAGGTDYPASRWYSPLPTGSGPAAAVYQSRRWLRECVIALTESSSSFAATGVSTIAISVLRALTHTRRSRGSARTTTGVRRTTTGVRRTTTASTALRLLE